LLPCEQEIPGQRLYRDSRGVGSHRWCRAAGEAPLRASVPMGLKQGSRSELQLSPVQPNGPRLSVTRGCRRWLRLCRCNRRTGSPLSCSRLCGCFSHIGVRYGATGPPRFWARLEWLLYICHGGVRCRRCQGYRCHGFPTQAKLFRQRRAVLRIGWSGKRMISL
jgi:hypothetical protein